MPNLWTHILFGRDVLREMGQEQLLTDPHLRNTYHFGAQGPDFLLYHNFWPWTKDTRVSSYGDVLHNERCGEFLLEMIQHVEQRPLADPLVVYVLGFISHYVLDRHVHPFVYYQSGYEKWKHQRYETIMDTIIARKVDGTKTWESPSWQQIYIGKHAPAELGVMFATLTARVFPHLAPTIRAKDWNTAYRHMIAAHRLFHDPTGLKTKATLGQIDPFVYREQFANLDYLNESHAVWHHPADETETFTYSVWDLWTMAKDDTIAIYEHVLALLTSEKADSRAERLAALATAIGNDSYDYGKPCDAGYALQYANPII